MRFVHKPTEIEAVQYEPGMEDGIQATVRGRHDTIFFADRSKMENHPMSSRIEHIQPAVLVGNVPISVMDGDWIVTEPKKAVMTDADLKRLYNPKDDDGEQNEKTEAAGRGHQEKDRKQPQGRPVQQGRSSLSDAVKK